MKRQFLIFILLVATIVFLNSLIDKLVLGGFVFNGDTLVNTKQVYKLNTRRRVCTLRSEEGVCVDLELSKAGMAALQTMIP